MTKSKRDTIASLRKQLAREQKRTAAQEYRADMLLRKCDELESQLKENAYEARVVLEKFARELQPSIDGLSQRIWQKIPGAAPLISHKRPSNGQLHVGTVM